VYRVRKQHQRALTAHLLASEVPGWIVIAQTLHVPDIARACQLVQGTHPVREPPELETPPLAASSRDTAGISWQCPCW
jgi:hypothetical protein